MCGTESTQEETLSPGTRLIAHGTFGDSNNIQRSRNELIRDTYVAGYTDNNTSAMPPVSQEAEHREEGSSTPKKSPQWGGMGNFTLGMNAAAETVSATMQGIVLDKMLDSNRTNDDELNKAKKQAGYASIATNFTGMIMSLMSACNDGAQIKNDKIDGKTGEKHSNNLNLASDIFCMGSKATSLTGNVVSAANGKEKVTGILGSSLGAIGSFLGMSAHADRVRRQNQAISELKKDPQYSTDNHEKHGLAEDYKRAAQAKRFGSGFETGAGVFNIISSGLGIASDSISAVSEDSDQNSKKLSAILGLASTVVGLISRGLSFIGGRLENSRKKKNKVTAVNEYFNAEINDIDSVRNSEVTDLSEDEKDNIVIARLGINVDDFSEQNAREQNKDEIFKRICIKRVKQARENPDFMETIGFKIDPENPTDAGKQASDDAILEALGYAD